MVISPLVRELIERQRESGESDRRFAQRLGVDWSFWSYVRKGDRRAGGKLIEGACRAFPELRSFVGQVWSDDHETMAARSTEAAS